MNTWSEKAICDKKQEEEAPGGCPRSHQCWLQLAHCSISYGPCIARVGCSQEGRAAQLACQAAHKHAPHGVAAGGGGRVRAGMLGCEQQECNAMG